MKKYLALLLALVMMMSLMAACGSKPAEEPEAPAAEAPAAEAPAAEAPAAPEAAEVSTVNSPFLHRLEEVEERK